ncbi:ankyrin repeat-containing domain protein [Hypoxylon crocopeplum]|nr:ankyrin repeat-containing domain protein [Hypoxylon crocopeplum]
MDGLTVSASIAGLVSVADLVFRATTRYVKSAKGARVEVQDLLNEVKHFSILLHSLSLVAYELESTPSTIDLTPRPASNLKLYYINDCQQVLNRIERRLANHEKDLESPSAFSRLQGRLKWPFSSAETKEMIQSIQRQKQTLSLARLDAVQDTVGKILDIENKIILDQARRDVLEFFTRDANPRPDFEMNKKLRHPLTGVWFMESPEFQEWHDNPGSKIWISGIPGAGKSVLAGAMIMECLQLSSANNRMGSAYFFCTHKDSRTHLPKNILSSLASQIARQNGGAFQILEEYYEELRSHKHLLGDPSPDRLLEVLARMSSFFDQVFVVVDGLDECDTHTDDVVKNELHIRLQLETDFNHVDVEANTEDIQLYVASELEKLISSKRLRLRDISLKDQIMGQLLQWCKGMFRWVACQLDHLCELPTDKARREALTKLPPTLPASYERILLRVESSNEQVQKLVQRSLQLIAADDEAVEADEIMRWCSSLIRRSTDCRRFEFAHYSVLEFLEGICSTHPSLRSYHVSHGKACSFLGPLCLRYLTFKNHERGPEKTKREIQHMSERNIRRPFYEHASMWWPAYVQGEDENTTVYQLLCTLFDIRKTANKLFFYEERTDFGRNEQTAVTVISAITRPDFTPLHMASALGLPSICQHLLEQGARVDLRSRFGTPLHCALGGSMVFSDVQSDVQFFSYKFAYPKFVFLGILAPSARSKISLHFSTPFTEATLLALPIRSSVYGEDFEMVADLIRAGTPVEDDYLKLFGFRYDIFSGARIPSWNKVRYDRGKAIMSLLEALGTPEDDSSPRARLHALTLNFARMMKLELEDSDTIREFLVPVIKHNDVTTMEKFVKDDRLQLIKTIEFPDSKDADILDLLLEAGCEPDRPAKDGRTPAYLCWQNRHQDMLRALVQHGASTVARDGDLNTVWHVYASSNCTRMLEVLIELNQDKNFALRLESRQGRTPICEALVQGCGEAVHLLLPHCPSIEYWKSDVPLFREAAELGSLEVIQKLLDIGIPLGNIDPVAGSPLHFVGMDASVECVKLLVKLFPHCQIQCKDGRTPFEAMLVRASKSSEEVDVGVFKELLTGFQTPECEKLGDLWPTVCSIAVPFMLSSEDEFRWPGRLLKYLLEIGVVNSYEEENKISAIVPLTIELDLVIGTLSPGAKSLRRGLFEENVDEALIATITSHWDRALEQPSVTQLLSEAILHDDADMIDLLLKRGVDLHHRADQLSALELACMPEVAISEANFTCLLSYAQVGQLERTNEGVGGVGIIHLAASLPSEDRTGVDCNLREMYSLTTARALLDFGADPWLVDSGGYNAALVARNLTPSWDQTCRMTIDGQFFSGGNALHLAALSGSIECLEFYIGNGLLGDLEATDDEMHTPMHYATFSDQWHVIQFLNEHGCNVNAVTRNGISPLHIALLFDMGSDVKACCSLGMTPLVYAYRGGDPSIIRLLKSHGSQVSLAASTTHPKGVSILVDALCVAIDRNDVRACEDLLSQGCPMDFDVESPWHHTPLMMAVCTKRNPEVVEWLVNNGATMSAVFQGPEMPKFLTVLEAAVARPMYNGLLPQLLTKYFEQHGDFLCLPRSPLHIAARNKNNEGLKILLSALQQKYGYLDLPRSQCGYGTPNSDCRLRTLVNQRDENNYSITALHSVAAQSSVEDAECLLANMADVDLPDYEGYTPLAYAADNGSTRVTELLFKHGSRLEPVSVWGETPLIRACRSCHFDNVKLLCDHSEPIIHTDNQERNLLCFLLFNTPMGLDAMSIWELLLNKGVDPFQLDIHGVSAIHRVLASQHQGLLKHIVGKDPGLSWITSVEWSPSRFWSLPKVNRTTINDITENYCLAHRYADSREPLQVSASVTTGEGSLFHLAVSWGLVKAIDNLLKIGADLEQECGEHGTALMISSANGHIDAVKLLVRKRAKMSYERGGIFKSAIAAALGHKTILHWLLVARHIEQRKIAHHGSDFDQGGYQCGNWSGICSVSIPLRWEWKQHRDETMIEYACRRQTILLSLRGQVVHPLD